MGRAEVAADETIVVCVCVLFDDTDTVGLRTLLYLVYLYGLRLLDSVPGPALRERTTRPCVWGTRMSRLGNGSSLK